MSPSPATISAAVLLAGGLRASPIATDLARSVLDLHLTPRHTGLELWLARIADLAPRLAPGFRVRVIHGGNGVVPQEPATIPDGLALSIEAHRGNFRGPAGIARDAAAYEDPDATLLIAEAARYCGSDLAPLLQRHAQRQAEITVATNPDGSPAGIYLVRAGTLAIVPEIGFTDLKEQWLSKAKEKGYAVWCDTLREPGALLLRTREDCLAAARAAAGLPARVRKHPILGDSATLEEGVSVIATGASIGEGAIVRDSIVCEGAEVGSNAVVVRSVLGPGARVEPGGHVVDLTRSGRQAPNDAPSRSGVL